MRILLLGEYSNVHWTLAEGLRALGHHVTVASNGDFWKNYPRDIDLARDTSSSLGTIRFLTKVTCSLPSFKSYDVVQLINPMFMELRAERLWPIYKYLRRHNGRVFLGAFGVDYFWVKVGMDCTTFRYSDFNIGGELRHNPDTDHIVADWLNTPKEELNRRIADDCDGIITGLYEYEACYRPFYAEKTQYIPFPINCKLVNPASDVTSEYVNDEPLRLFIGIQRERSAYKGTDIMLRALERLKNDYPEQVEIMKAESVPFAQYQEMMNNSHALLDQLYSYTPGMNGLLAMSKGLILIGGGEEEHYELLGERNLRPIINVQPTEEDVYDQISDRLLSVKEDIAQLQRDSIEYIRRHHDHIRVAQQYLDFWTS